MISQFLRSVLARFPPIAHRDRRIAKLERRVAAHEKRFARPSFQTKLHTEVRLRELESASGVPSVGLISRGKFFLYDLVRSHGIDLPEPFGRWDQPEDIPWGELPDRVAIKAAHGTMTRGVLPLRRVAGGWQIVTHEEILTDEQVTAELRTRITDRRVRGPFAAEELLLDESGTRPPTDVKAYCFYGEVPLIELRQTDEHGTRSASRYRIIDADANDLVDHYFRGTNDPTIPVPAELSDLVDAAQRLSLALRRPFVRIDMYGIDGRVVFGELTPRPGGTGWFGAEIDHHLGEKWEEAEARLTKDVAFGASREPQMGPLAGQDGIASSPPEVPKVAAANVRIADLQEQVANLERRNAWLEKRHLRLRVEHAKKPSFRIRIHAKRRIDALAAEISGAEIGPFTESKLEHYALARSHGFALPDRLGTWDDPADIPWDDLPDLVVVKSEFGSTSRGVLPLRRVGGGRQIVTHDATLTGPDLTALLTARVDEQLIRGRFIAEEFLDDGGGGSRLPIESKVYGFYGEVPMVLLSRSPDHGNVHAARFRVVDGHGEDVITAEQYAELAETNPRLLDGALAQVDMTIPVPERIGEVIDIAKHLSSAVRLPFARIDLYALSDRVVFGELTPNPGGPQELGHDLDVVLGDAWERAQARLDQDIADGMPPGFEWGPARVTAGEKSPR